MKSFKFFSIVLFSVIISLFGCNDTKKAQKQNTTKTSIVSDSTSTQKTTSATPITTEPAQNAQGVWHYTCRLGCPGGSGSAVNCKTCGNVLAHNTTYHASGTANSSAPFANPSNTAATPAVPEPSQNAAGVWHYTCEKGCLGGSGAAGTCKTCGGTLAHNQAYH